MCSQWTTIVPFRGRCAMASPSATSSVNSSIRETPSAPSSSRPSRNAFCQPRIDRLHSSVRSYQLAPRSRSTTRPPRPSNDTLLHRCSKGVATDMGTPAGIPRREAICRSTNVDMRRCSFICAIWPVNVVKLTSDTANFPKGYRLMLPPVTA